MLLPLTTAQRRVGLLGVGATDSDMYRERDRWRVLLEVNNALVSTLELTALFEAIASVARSPA